MSWQDLFWRGREAEVRVSGYFQHPDQLTAPERVAYYDRSAAETIKRLRETAEALEGYRQALAARYATLAAMPTSTGWTLCAIAAGMTSTSPILPLWSACTKMGTRRRRRAPPTPARSAVRP